MIDGYGRNIDYIRISVTDRCNLRCVYCMPKDCKITSVSKEYLKDEEIIRLCRIFSILGIKKIKITGGEPLLRNNIDKLIKDIKSIDGIEYISVTTNGIFLEEKAEALKDADIDGINISMDAAEEKLFHKITGADKYVKVMKGIEKILECNIPNIKINCVAIKGYNENQLNEVAVMAKENKIDVRFIEMMPIGYGNSFKMIKEEEIRETLEQKYGKLKINEEKRGNGPAVYYRVEGFKGNIGFISAVSHKFCNECNRVRLTSSGFLKNCLQYDEGIDLKSYLRVNASDELILDLVKDAILRKPLSHNFNSELKNGNVEIMTMAQIGG